MASTESLFSFEVAVQHLRINATTVACRFPALAVKLLDFPTLLIALLDKTERESVRQVILGAGGKVPNMFKDLLDPRGNFQFDKGKSCMFKSDVFTLHENLQNIPLYVMVVDLWGETQKLIGVCTIPLNDITSCIRHDVEIKGISCPSMHGQQDAFPIFNLMGSEVGNVSLGYRMLSLGQSIMSHIPVATPAEPMQSQPDKKRGQATSHSESNADQANVLQLQESECESETGRNKGDVADSRFVPCKNFQVYTDQNDAPHSVSQANGCDRERNQSISMPSAVSGTNDQHTQTYHRGNSLKTRSGRKSNMETEMPFDPLVIVTSNTHCPPPLFFNSNHVSNYEHVPYPQPYRMGSIPPNPPEQASTSPTDSSSTESSESYHSKTMQVDYELQNGSPWTWSVRKVVRESQQVRTKAPKMSVEEPVTDTCSEEEWERMKGMVNCRGASMPILTALLEELSILTGVKSDNFQRVVSGPFEEKENIQPKDKVEERSSPGILTSRDMVPDIPLNLQSPKLKPCRHDRCAKPPKPVPSGKGWLRKEPKLETRQTKLHFKMTHSQRLRLKMNNPALLKTMEAEELRKSSQRSAVGDVQEGKRMKRVPGIEKRRTRSKTKKPKVGSAAMSDSSHSFHHYHPDVATEVARTSGEKIGEEAIPPPSRPPVPTPRRSLSKDGAFDLSEFEDQHGRTIPSESMGVAVQHGFDVSASEKSATRSIEVYIPNPALVESDHDSDRAGEQSDNYKSEESSHNDQIDEAEASVKRNLEIPGFRVESVESPTNRSSVYSQDFESIKDDSDRSQSVNGSQSSQSSPYSDQASSDKESSSRVSVPSDRQGTVKSPGSSKSSSRSEERLLDSVKSSKSWSPEELSKVSRGDSRQPTLGEELRDLDLPKAGGRDQRNTGDGSGKLPIESALSRLMLPQPPLSSVSPVPQHRNPIGRKIVMTKPVSINVDEYNDSGEVNLPSDLSVSLDDRQQRRDTAGSFGSSQDGPHGYRGEDSHGRGLDVIRSNVESKEIIHEYSHDFDSD